MATPEQQAAFDALDFNSQVRMAGMFRGYALSPPEIDAMFRVYARAHYGAMAAYLDHPEIGPILSQAAHGAWSNERLIGAIQQTQFWKTTNDAQRQFDLLQRTDPATAKRAVDNMVTTINTFLTQQGTSLPPNRITELATQLLRNGAQEDQIPTMVLAEVEYNPTSPQGGRLGAEMTQVRGLADQYALPMSEEVAFNQAKALSMGTQTPEGLQELLSTNARAAYAHLGDRIGAGNTVRQILDPQIQTAAGLLGISATQIDLRDPKWASLIQFDPGEGTLRERDIGETSKYVKTLDEYWVDNPNSEAEVAQKVTMLAQQLGRQ